MAKVNESEVVEVMKKALEPGGTDLNLNSKVADVSAWDSLGHLSILAALDTKFDGKVAEIDEMATADSVKKVLDLLRKHSLI